MTRINFTDKGSCPKCGSENTFFKYQDGDYLKFDCGRCKFQTEMKTKEQTEKELKQLEMVEKIKSAESVQQKQ